MDVNWLPYVPAVIAAAGWLLQWKKQRADLAKQQTEADLSYAGELRQEKKDRRAAEAEAEGLRNAVDDSSESARRREEEMRTARMEVVRLGLELAACRKAFPAILWPHIQAISDDLCYVLGVAGACTITEPVGGGTFRWVSEKFAAGLGMTSDEFLACDWKALLDPRDLERTSAAESSAQGQRVRLTNRFRHKNGSLVWLRWTSTQYLAGISFSYVEFLNVPETSE